MGEAKRRRELGHMRRRNTYTFIVTAGPQVQYLSAPPVDEDDEDGIRHALELHGSEADDWEEAMGSVFEFHELDEPPSLPTHLRCELLVERIRKGGSVFYNSLFPKELAYSSDGGQTWQDFSPQPDSEDGAGTDTSPPIAPLEDSAPLASLQLDPDRPAFETSHLKTFQRHGQPVTPTLDGPRAEEVIAQDRSEKPHSQPESGNAR